MESILVPARTHRPAVVLMWALAAASAVPIFASVAALAASAFLCFLSNAIAVALLIRGSGKDRVHAAARLLIQALFVLFFLVQVLRNPAVALAVRQIAGMAGQ